MILVTGGTGYLGRAVVKRLIEEGNRVKVFCRNAEDTANESHIGEVHIGDVTNPGQLDEAMRGVKVVYHLAALVDHYASEEQLHRVNVQGTCNVIESALRRGVERVVHCSSVSAEPGGGSTAYGRSKIEAEKRLEAYRGKIAVITLRPGPVYDEERKNLQRLIRFVRFSHVCPRLVPDVTLHLASRKNVTDAFLRAKDAGIPGRAYAICDRYPVKRSVLTQIIRRETATVSLALPLRAAFPFLQLAARGCERLQSRLGVRPLVDRHYLKVLTRERGYDISLARYDLGYDPATTEQHFAEAVRACLGKR